MADANSAIVQNSHDDDDDDGDVEDQSSSSNEVQPKRTTIKELFEEHDCLFVAAPMVRYSK